MTEFLHDTGGPLSLLFINFALSASDISHRRRSRKAPLKLNKPDRLARVARLTVHRRACTFERSIVHEVIALVSSTYFTYRRKNDRHWILRANSVFSPLLHRLIFPVKVEAAGGMFSLSALVRFYQFLFSAVFMKRLCVYVVSGTFTI